MEVRKHKQDPGRVQVVFDDVVRLELCGVITCPRGFEGQPHAHPFWELIHVADGRGVFLVDGKRRRVEAGKLYLLQPHQEHRFRNNRKQAYRNLYLGFSFGFWPAKKSKGELPFQIDDFLVETCFGDVFAEIAGDPESARTAMLANRSRLLTGVAELARQLVEAPETITMDDRDAMLASKAKAFLAEHVNRTITVEEVAGLFYLSPHYVADLFKEQTGQSIKQYHLTLRMRKAFSSLKRGAAVSSVGEELGFSSVAYFSRRFKDYFGMPPSRVGR